MTSRGTFIPSGLWHSRSENKLIDVRKGGQFGWSSDYDGIVNSTPHTSNNVICRVLQSPRGFNLLPDQEAQYWHASWKALFELHPKSISGLNRTLNPSWNGVNFNGTGEEIEVPIGMQRAKSDVTMSFYEKYGRIITRMVESYHRLYIMDEDTKHPGIAMLHGDNMHDGLLDFYTWTMIFIEPGRYLEQVNSAWLVTNMGIKNSVDFIGKRDKTGNNDTLEFDLQFSGVAQVGWGVDAVASEILKQMRATQADPYRAPAFLKGPTADIADRTDVGFMEGMMKSRDTMVSRTE